LVTDYIKITFPYIKPAMEGTSGFLLINLQGHLGGQLFSLHPKILVMLYCNIQISS